MNPMKLVVESTHIDVRSGVSTRTGQPYSMPEQSARLYMPNGEVRVVMVGVEPDQPLAVGEYAPKDSAWFLDKYNEPKCSLAAGRPGPSRQGRLTHASPRVRVSDVRHRNRDVYRRGLGGTCRFPRIERCRCVLALGCHSVGFRERVGMETNRLVYQARLTIAHHKERFSQ